MTKPGFIIGIIITSVSILMFLSLLLVIITGDGSELEYKYMMYCVIGGVVGGILMSANTTSNQERQEYEDYKRMKRQETAMYYRFKDAKGKSIEEYTMDDKTKLMVYYERLPPKYQKKVLDEVDRIYRQFESDLYTKK